MKTDGCAYLHEAMESSGNGKCVGERHLSALPATEESLPLSRISNPPLWATTSISALFLKAHLLSSPAQTFCLRKAWAGCFHSLLPCVLLLVA